MGILKARSLKPYLEAPLTAILTLNMRTNVRQVDVSIQLLTAFRVQEEASDPKAY